MKRIIAVMLAVVLVISGLGSFVFAQDSVNEVGAEFITNWEYRTSGDTFNNHEVTGEKHWYTWLNNRPDDTGELVYEPNVTLDSDLIFDHVHEEYLEPGYPPYHWLFDNIPDGEGEDAGMGFESPNPYTVTFTPGFDASRSADITEFLQSEGMQVQTITIEVTPQENMQEVVIGVEAEEDKFVNPVITSATTDGPNVYLDLDEHQVWIGVHDDEGIATCTFTITIEVTPKVDLVEFMPEVCVEWSEVYNSGTISGSSISCTADPDDDIGIWTSSAAGSYQWEWSATYMRRVTFPAHPVNEVGAEIRTIWVYKASGDTFVNDEVTGEKKEWDAFLDNNPDDTGAPVTEVTLTLASELEFDEIWDEEYLTTMGPATYVWSFGEVLEEDGVHGGVGFWSPSPYTVTFTPGFDAYRSADITGFLQSDGMQVQTITVAVTPMVTPQEKMQELGVCVDAWEDNFVNAVITSATTDGPNVYLDLDEHQVWIAVHDDEGIATCTFTFTIEVTPKVDLVEFMPRVTVEWPEVYYSGTDSGSSVSGIADPDDEIGIWTWSAEGSYYWEWKEEYLRRVIFPGEIEIGPHEPIIESLVATPEYLWPLNHKAVDVTLTVDATDANGPEDIVRTTYSVADEYEVYDVAETDLPEDGVISLIAARDGKDKDGRVYTITVTVYDAGGLSDSASVEVVVPHDQGKGEKKK